MHNTLRLTPSTLLILAFIFSQWYMNLYFFIMFAFMAIYFKILKSSHTFQNRTMKIKQYHLLNWTIFHRLFLWNRSLMEIIYKLIIGCVTTGERIGNGGVSECRFPFTYNWKRYTWCTTDNSYHGRLWCRIKSKGRRTKNFLWGYCDEETCRK